MAFSAAPFSTSNQHLFQLRLRVSFQKAFLLPPRSLLMPFCLSEYDSLHIIRPGMSSSKVLGPLYGPTPLKCLLIDPHPSYHHDFPLEPPSSLNTLLAKLVEKLVEKL